jgi:hypothetical protein
VNISGRQKAASPACQEYGHLDGALANCLTRAVQFWAASVFHSEEIVMGLVVPDAGEDRYLVDFAVRQVGYWRVAEVWVEGGEITLIADLGEGFPADGAPWPWVDAPG